MPMNLLDLSANIHATEQLKLWRPFLQVAEQAGEMQEDVKKFSQYTYPTMTRTQVSVDSP